MRRVGVPVRVLVLRLSRQQREQINLSGLRGLGNPTQDPLAASAQDPRVRVSLDEPVEFDGGFHGVHTVFAFTEPGSDTVVTDQTVLLDAATTTMFVFQVACQEECYLETHKNIAGEDVVAVLGGTEGPLIDGRAYHEPTFLAELETYHAAVESAHQQHEKVTLPLPSTNGSTPGDVPQASLT